MSDSETEYTKKKTVHSDSSDEDAPLTGNQHEGLEDSSPTSSESSAPKVEAMSGRDSDTEEEEEEKEEEKVEKKEESEDEEEEEAINQVREKMHIKEETAAKEMSSESSDTDDDEETTEDRMDGSVTSKHEEVIKEDHEEEEEAEEQLQASSPDIKLVSRPESPERKSSHGSSSYEEDRANSLSPEPTVVISNPLNNAGKGADPNSSQKDVTKIYTEALTTDPAAKDSFAEKIVRSKPASDITQIYTASLQKEQQSPRLERARGGKPVKDITQLYTAAFNKQDENNDIPSPNRPRRNDNITKLYTGGFENKNNFAKPNDEITNPRKHNMATSIDREGMRDAYASVMSDNNGVEWAAFKFDGTNQLVVSDTGNDFSCFKSQFGPDDRGFGYIKIQTGDEVSKRSRFVLVTWVGANVSVMKKAKMSTDKLLVKEVIQNLSVELQLENQHELSLENLKAEVDKAGGAR